LGIGPHSSFYIIFVLSKFEYTLFNEFDLTVAEIWSRPVDLLIPKRRPTLFRFLKGVHHLGFLKICTG